MILKNKRKGILLVSAASIMTLGATCTAFAAQSGTWKLEDAGWRCYDEDGEAYEEEFCLSNGIEFYVDYDGYLVTSEWVEDEEGYACYVGSSGAKTVNNWRLLAPMYDEDEEEQWYYFDANGRRVENKKMVIGGHTYYFNEEGIMLTGWVNTEDEISSAYSGFNDISHLVYCDETGARVSNSWVYDYEPGIDEYEDDVDEEDKNWYYIKSLGTLKTGKGADINGETYFFGEDGKMLSGWVAEIADDIYVEISNEDDNEYDLKDFSDKAVYFCNSSDDGHATKGKWKKTWNNKVYEEEDEDNEKSWFYFDSYGRVFLPKQEDNSDLMASQYVVFEDGEYSEPFDVYTSSDAEWAEIKVIDDKKYAFNENGEMISGLVKLGGNMYYFGEEDDGAMKTGSQKIEDEGGVEYKFYFAKETDLTEGYKMGAGIDGALSGYLYKDGLLQTSGEDDLYKVITLTIHNSSDELNGEYSYLVNENGKIQTKQDEEYELSKAWNGDFTLNPKEADLTIFDEADGAFKGYLE